MKLFYSPASPFVRKCMACAIEMGLEGKIIEVPSAVSPIEAEKNIAPVNPAAKLPTLMTDDGQAIYDSRVIVEYLDALAGGGKMIPNGKDRWKALVLQSACDEALDACLLARYETVLRPEALRWQAWTDGQLRKVSNTLDMLEGEWNHYLASHVNVGVINACVLIGYLDFRFTTFDWRKDRPKLAAWYEGFAKRPAMEKTAPRM